MISDELDSDIDALPWLEARRIAAELASGGRSNQINLLARQVLQGLREEWEE